MDEEQVRPERPEEILSPNLNAEEIEAEHGTEAPPVISFKTVLLQFLKQLTSSTDLYQLSAPAIMLNGISLLEYCLHWAEYPKLLLGINCSEDPLGIKRHHLDRMIGVCRWFISCLHGSYASRTGYERKPYNPTLGEQFHATWPESDLILTAEQGE